MNDLDEESPMWSKAQSDDMVTQISNLGMQT